MVTSIMVSVLSEVIFKASRSSGAGGQHVNKVASRVTLRFSVRHSKLLRTVTEPSASVVKARVASKRRQGEKKALRQVLVEE